MLAANASLLFAALGLPLLVAARGAGEEGAGALRTGTRARYRVLPAEVHQAPPFQEVRFTRGPRRSGAGASGQALWDSELEVRPAPGEPPLFQLRLVTEGDLLAGGDGAPVIHRYQLRVPGSGETLEYRDVHTGRALLPAWADFTRHFFPRPARGSRRQEGVPNTCSYLGHVLSLHGLEQGVEWEEWEDVTILELDSELLIGTGRVVKDAKGRRLPQKPERQDYDYVRWTREDYERMIEAGFNTFALVPGIEPFLRGQPVFYRRGLDGDPPLSYPADLYRSNYRGELMYEDEPACIMVGDREVHTQLRYFSDAAELLKKRVRGRSLRRAGSFEDALRRSGASLGDLRLLQLDYAVWETRFETAFYQLEAGFAGFVHEGRYRLDDFYGSGYSFDEYVKASTGLERKHTAEEMLRYYYAFLRGAARHFGKHWGVSIYGQADPEISPLAVRLAYDMGARYVWFWTSDHDHHLPWPEQLALARLVRRHAAEKPRRSIREASPVLDRVIVIPYGSFLVLESPAGRRHHWDLWWVRELDREGKNEASKRYRRLLRAAFVEIHEALDAGEEFDITVDDGRPIAGYRRVVRVAAGGSE